MPELELQTTAYWLTAEAPRERWRRDDLDVALLGAGRAIQTVAAFSIDTSGGERYGQGEQRMGVQGHADAGICRLRES